MKKKITAGFAFAMLLYLNSNAQSLAVNTDGSTANPSALLDVKSTNKGLLIPRMSKAQKNAIAAPATGLLVFQNAPDSTGFHYYDGAGWTWLSNSVISQDWLINGNDNIGPSNYLGTNTNHDLRFAVNTFERSRISSSTGFWGFGGETNPQYELDASMGSGAIFPCLRNGIRFKPAGFTNDCDNGLFFGLDNNSSIANASIWNYGNGGSGAQNLKFGMNNVEIMRLNDWGFEGLGESNPQYNFDMRLGIAAVFPCGRNGIRMNHPGNTNDCDRGLFLGYDNNVIQSEASLWNFGDGSAFPLYSFRFGMGNDFVTGEKMRITANGVGIGSIDPQAKVHIIDRTGILLPGVMTTSGALAPLSFGFYSGLRDNSGASTARLWNYQNAGIEIGTNDIQRMVISPAGNVGITTSTTPTSTLQVDGTIAVGVSLNVTGGSIGTPTILNAEKSYVELNPAGGAYYQLPNPANCVGRMYYLRNNDAAVTAQLGTVSGAICPASGTCLGAGAYHPLSAVASGKTVIAISDGSNWIVGAIN
jgi:hypothetical protein